MGNGQGLWVALLHRYDGNGKNARREYHHKLHTIMIESGDDSEDFFFVMDGNRDRLDEVGQPTPTERYEDILRALHADNERFRSASCGKRDFYLVDNRHMASTMYVDHLSRENATSVFAGRGELTRS